MKFIRNFRGARKGDAFPTEFKAGEECPPELVSAAQAAGVVDAGGEKNGKAGKGNEGAADTGGKQA